MTNPRTEAVARAIRQAESDHFPSITKWQALSDEVKAMYIARAQAAEKALIEALMEPSAEMVEAGSVLAGFGGYPDPENAERVFTAMLLAAGGDGDK